MTKMVTVAIEYMSLDEEDIARSYEDEGFHEQGEPHWVDDCADHLPDGGCQEDGRCDDDCEGVDEDDHDECPECDLIDPLSVCCCACVRDVSSGTSDATTVHGGGDSDEAAEGDGRGAY